MSDHRLTVEPGVLAEVICRGANNLESPEMVFAVLLSVYASFAESHPSYLAHAARRLIEVGQELADACQGEPAHPNQLSLIQH